MVGYPHAANRLSHRSQDGLPRPQPGERADAFVSRALDVNDDGMISSQDVLAVINYINSRSAGWSGLECSACAIMKIVKRHVDTVRFLFSPDPHELASWVKQICRLIGHRFPGPSPVPHCPLPPPEAAEAGSGGRERCGVAGFSSTISFTHEASSWGSCR